MGKWGERWMVKGKKGGGLNKVLDDVLEMDGKDKM